MLSVRTPSPIVITAIKPRTVNSLRTPTTLTLLSALSISLRRVLFMHIIECFAFFLKPCIHSIVQSHKNCVRLNVFEGYFATWRHQIRFPLMHTVRMLRSSVLDHYEHMHSLRSSLHHNRVLTRRTAQPITGWVIGSDWHRLAQICSSSCSTNCNNPNRRSHDVQCDCRWYRGHGRRDGPCLAAI